MKKMVIFDWGRTLYDAETEALFPETKYVLEALFARGHVLVIVALATAGEEKIKERKEIIETENLSKYFDAIHFDIENKNAMYDQVLRSHTFEPKNIVVVDDRVIRGVWWGNAHGCTTVWVKNGKFAHEDPTEETGNPSHVVQSISEVAQLPILQ